MTEDGHSRAQPRPAAAPRPVEEQLREARAALAARDNLLAERGARLAALEDVADRLAVATSRLQEVSVELEALRLARRSELAERDHRISRLEALLAESAGSAAPRRDPDDLKEIKGIGPAIEALLHELGITTFEQVAALEGESLQRVGDLLGVFRGRIQQDGWIGQAAELARRRDATRPA